MHGIVRDDKQRDFRQAFEDIKQTLPKGNDAPALVIVAHTRKPKADEQKGGRALLHELSGSHALGSVPRCVFIMQAASTEETDDRVVWTCAKNNDGALGQRSAWHRRNGLFAQCGEFDWRAFDDGAEKRRKAVQLSDVMEAFDGGAARLSRKRAAEALMEVAEIRKTVAYAALAADGPFAEHLKETNGLLEYCQ